MIRMKHGSVKKFVETYGLNRNAVNDVLSGRKARPTAEIIAKDLGYTVHELWPAKYQSVKSERRRKTTVRHDRKGR